ncbi:hypothetical protein [Mycolicibacterium fortuitum]|uniref:hypothetical protein n=1 Tax=Mycolicibacterium fortuitum TaxID=1766 RepID=UPI0026350E17|nr:hypothetical protein [Mycolicibacterium fortuitum]
MSTWKPINDYPGDQLYDDIPSTPTASFWGEIGREQNGVWSWTIMATDDQAQQWEAAGGVADTEDAAKRTVETWRAE